MSSILNYPFIVEVYEAEKTELAAFLSPKSLSHIQRTYTTIKKMNVEHTKHYLHYTFDVSLKRLGYDIDKCVRMLN